ncbi:MAG: divergent polysaccharide deacetylase family protein [Alphaproteobacteria bacterium]|nr:divergent polysaccharide deacetylase family protein [Alphaproteobacteria bacterium]
MLLAVALSAGGAIGYFGAESWSSAMDPAESSAPGVAVWLASLPPAAGTAAPRPVDIEQPQFRQSEPPQAEPPQAEPPRPDSAPAVRDMPPGDLPAALRGEFTDAPDVIEPGTVDAAPAEPSPPGLSRASAQAEPIVLPPDPSGMGEPSVEPPGEPVAAASKPVEQPQLAALTPGPELEEGRRPGARIGDGATAAWRLNAVPFADKPSLKLVAIIIDDAGIDRARTSRALRLPGPLTISFLPYAPEVARQAEEARKRGHELMVHLPMEPLSSQENPGPDALTTRLARPELMRRLALNLGRFDGYVGVNNHMGSRMTADANAMLPVLEELRDQGLLFIDSRTTKDTVAALVAAHLGLATGARDVFIDHEQITGSVRARLADIERIAKRGGAAIAIGHPHERTLDELERWLPGLAEQGLTLAPISAVVRRGQGRS